MCGNRLEKVAKKITRSFFLFAQVAHPEVAWAHAPARLEVDRAQATMINLFFGHAVVRLANEC